MEVRKATIKDLKEIQALCQKLFEKEHEEYDKLLDLDWTFGEKGEKYFKDSMTKSNSCVFVAVEADSIIGYLAGEIVKGEEYRKLPKMAEVGSLFVLDEYRSKGVGKELYDEFVKWAKGNDVKRVKVEASPGNEKGINYYEKMGFEGITLVLEGAI